MSAVFPPDVALPQIQNRIDRLATLIADAAPRDYLSDPVRLREVTLLGIVRDLADVVQQIAEQGGAR